MDMLCCFKSRKKCERRSYKVTKPNPVVEVANLKHSQIQQHCNPRIGTTNSVQANRDSGKCFRLKSDSLHPLLSNEVPYNNPKTCQMPCTALIVNTSGTEMKMCDDTTSKNCNIIKTNATITNCDTNLNNKEICNSSAEDHQISKKQSIVLLTKESSNCSTEDIEIVVHLKRNAKSNNCVSDSKQHNIGKQVHNDDSKNVTRDKTMDKHNSGNEQVYTKPSHICAISSHPTCCHQSVKQQSILKDTKESCKTDERDKCKINQKPKCLHNDRVAPSEGLNAQECRRMSSAVSELMKKLNQYPNIVCSLVETPSMLNSILEQQRKDCSVPTTTWRCKDNTKQKRWQHNRVSELEGFTKIKQSKVIPLVSDPMKKVNMCSNKVSSQKKTLDNYFRQRNDAKSCRSPLLGDHQDIVMNKSTAHSSAKRPPCNENFNKVNAHSIAITVPSFNDSRSVFQFFERYSSRETKDAASGKQKCCTSNGRTQKHKLAREKYPHENSRIRSNSCRNNYQQNADNRNGKNYHADKCVSQWASNVKGSCNKEYGLFCNGSSCSCKKMQGIAYWCIEDSASPNTNSICRQH